MCSAKKVPWWNKEMWGLRVKTRRRFTVAKRTGDRNTYKETLTCYNEEIGKAKNIFMEEVLADH
jgi:hypothetical protein